MRNVATNELKQPIVPLTVNFKQPLFIIAFGCVHKGSSNHAEHDWQKFCEYYKEFCKDNQCLFIGIGDYIEFFSKRERVALSNPDLHESTIDKLDVLGVEAVDDFYKDVSFMAGKLIGLIEGNHHWEFSDGSTSTMALCKKLNCRYLAAGMYGKIQCTDKQYRVKHTIDIYAAHSSSGTITMSGSLAKAERFSGSVMANIYILGHDHQHITANMPLVTLHLSKDGQSIRTVEYQRCVVRSGSFMRVYTEGSKSYAIDKLYKPTGIGNGQIEVYFGETRCGDRYYKLNPQLKSW